MSSLAHKLKVDFLYCENESQVTHKNDQFYGVSRPTFYLSLARMFSFPLTQFVWSKYDSAPAFIETVNNIFFYDDYSRISN